MTDSSQPSTAMAQPPRQDASKPWLTHIPLEVLTRITYYVSTTDLGSIRLTCRAVEQALFHFFAHEFFRKRQFMVSTFSLQTLIDISNHPTLSPFLTHVIFATDRLQRGAIASTQSPSQRRAVEDYITDIEALIHGTGILRDMLAEAFGNLRNLETIEIRDYNSRTRTRDGSFAVWRSYGSKSLENSTGSKVISSLDYDFDGRGVTPNVILSSILSALASATPSSSPKSIEVNFRSSHTVMGDVAFFIHSRIEPPLDTVLQRLTKLHLSIHAAGNPDYVQFVRKFLSKTPNLTWLRINGPVGQEVVPFTVSPAEWLCPDSISQDISPIQLRFVERLDLGSIAFSADQLLKTVTAFAPSIRCLCLRRVRVADKNPDDDTKVNPWMPFLSSLRKVPGIKIEHFELSLLSQERRDYKPDQILFGNEERREAIFKGDSTQVLVKNIMGDMKTEFIKIIPDPETDSDNDMDSLDGHEVFEIDEDMDEDEE